MTSVLPHLPHAPQVPSMNPDVYVPSIYAPGIAPMSERALDNVSRLTTEMLKQEQLPYHVWHTLNGGVYTRMVKLPGGLWTGAMVQRASTLTVIGDALIYIGEDAPIEVTGVTVIPAGAGRRQAFLAKGPITLVMTAACDAATVEEAEAYLCAETHLLPPLSEDGKHTITISGE